MLDEIETAWLREAPAAINCVVQANSTETFYAASFWLFYCDCTTMGVPALAMNAESAIVTHQTQNDAWNTRWVPAEWRWPVLDEACDAMKPLYMKLSDAMADASHSAWNELIASHDRMIAHVAKTMTHHVHNRHDQFAHARLPACFVVAAIDDQRDSRDFEDLLRSSVEPDQLDLFRCILTR